MDKVTGNISPVNKVSGNIITDKTVSGNITYGVGGDIAPIYEGDYEVLPLAFEETVLPTKDKKLIEDIVVKEIPYYETSNTSGGNTVYIAGHVEFG